LNEATVGFCRMTSLASYWKEALVLMLTSASTCGMSSIVVRLCVVDDKAVSASPPPRSRRQAAENANSTDATVRRRSNGTGPTQRHHQDHSAPPTGGVRISGAAGALGLDHLPLALLPDPGRNVRRVRCENGRVRPNAPARLADLAAKPGAHEAAPARGAR
jgi:hypothetical protein